MSPKHFSILQSCLNFQMWKHSWRYVCNYWIYLLNNMDSNVINLIWSILDNINRNATENSAACIFSFINYFEVICEIFEHQPTWNDVLQFQVYIFVHNTNSFQRIRVGILFALFAGVKVTLFDLWLLFELMKLCLGLLS